MIRRTQSYIIFFYLYIATSDKTELNGQTRTVTNDIEEETIPPKKQKFNDQQIFRDLKIDRSAFSSL